MYRTVRHGENSLQYKILAQQEEGIPNVKRKNFTRGKAAGVITIVLLLICGVIATAILVPLVLTNDFITLTGTFQKFSVSTLRRSHSGNHVVVIAKKPHGWNSSRQSFFQPPTKATNNSSYHINNKPKETTISTEAIITINDTSFKSNEISTKTVLPKIIPTFTTAFKTKASTTPTTTTVEITEPEKSVHQKLDIRKENEPTSTMNPASNYHEKGTNLGAIRNKEQISSSPSLKPTSLPSWYHNQGWTIETPNSLINWTQNPLASKSFSTTVGGVCAVAIILIMIVVLVKSFPDRHKNIQLKETEECKEDKTRLLKPSARTSDEE